MTQVPCAADRRAVLMGAVSLAALPWTAFAARADANADGDLALRAAIREAVGDRQAVDGGIALRAPALAENGGQVPISVLVDTPQTPADHAVAIHIFATRNPTPGVASFRLTEKLGRAEVQTRIRLAQEQTVIVLAQMNDGRVLRAAADVRVTTGGCLT
jgi:sulfur-oxidizing protein SoxY